MSDQQQEHDELKLEFEVLPDTAETKTKEHTRSIVEVLLDPRTLQGLMTCGAGLLVLGLVAWLWSIGMFENPVVVATCLGVGNVALIAGGVSTVRYSRYQIAGTAMTMLGCLVMPLNLWFYDAQGLITLDQGGHLWVPALLCCLIYAGVARVLADPKFVFAIVGGVTLTGLLLLADQHVDRFWEILSPSALMVVIGMICIHAERAFAPGEGPFSRENFGKAFFQAGHIVLASGLMLLFGGRLAGWFYEPLLAEFGWFDAPLVSTKTNLKLFAMLLALSGAYSYVYSQLVVKARGRYAASAVLTMLWSVVILFDLLNIAFTMSLLTLLLALAALALNLASSRWHADDTEQEAGFTARAQAWLQSSRPLISALHVVVALLGVILYGRVRIEILHHWWNYDFDWMYLAAIAVAGASCVWSALIAEKQGRGNAVVGEAQFAALFAMLLTAGVISVAGIALTVPTLAAEMLVPMALAGMSLVARNETRRQSWARAGEFAGGLVMLASLAAALGLVEIATSSAAPHLWLSLLFTEATVAFGIASIHSERGTTSALSAASLCAAAWQTILWLDFTTYAPIVAATTVGVVALAIARAMELFESKSAKRISRYQYLGMVGVSLGGLAALLLSLARVMVGEAVGSLIGLLILQTIATAISAVLVKDAASRRFLSILATGEFLVMVLVVNVLSGLNILQKGELFVTILGLVMVGFGYAGWLREGKEKDELVSFNLAFGSLLSAGPLVVGLLHQRFWDPADAWGWVMMHEVGVLAVGLLLLGAGLVCRIRWSTLIGSGTLIAYVVSLLGLLSLPDKLQSTAVYMMVGGGLFFAVAVLLSIYRDRLLALPEKVREGEGVFQVLKWR